MSADAPTPSLDFPPGLEDQFLHLCDEAIQVHAMWCLFLDLFANPDGRRVGLATAPGAFRLIEIAVRDNMVMGFGRLTDKPQIGNRNNLSIPRLLDSIRGHWPDERQRQVETLWQVIRDAGGSLTRLRNRQVGHSDLETALATRREPIPPVTEDEVEHVFGLVARLINTVGEHFRVTASPAREYLLQRNGCDLVLLLDRAMRQKAEGRRLLGGH